MVALTYQEVSFYCMSDTERMLAEKTPHSIFVPELVLAALLPEDFPPWKRCVQVESLQWLLQCMEQFFENPRCAGCIVSADNQLLHDREISDSQQLTRWASTLVRSRVCGAQSRDTLFCEVATTVLRNVAFRGADDALEGFLKSLRDEFENVAKTMQFNPTWFKHEAVKAINAFEHTKLPRNARALSARVISKHQILFGGMVYACAFSLAFVRLMWMDRKTLMLMKLGVVPSFRGAMPRGSP